MVEANHSDYVNGNAVKIFECLVSSINPRVELDKLEKALKNVVRGKDEDISSTLDKLRSVALQILKHRNPDVSEQVKATKLTNMLRIELSNYVSPAALPEYKKWRRDMIRKYSENSSLVTICDKIQELEMIFDSDVGFLTISG